MNLMKFVRENKVIAVIRAENSKTALELADACIQGGLKLIEVTFSFPGAEDVIRELAKRDDILVAAGTLLNLDMAKTAADSGAKFLISPHTDSEIISYTKKNDLLVASGALTSNEIVQAWKLGADFVKIFPIKSVGGASYIKAVKEPLPFVEVMVTGGVTIDNFTEFLNAGATVVGLSSSIIGSSGRFDSAEVISQRARKVMEKVAQISN